MSVITELTTMKLEILMVCYGTQLCQRSEKFCPRYATDFKVRAKPSPTKAFGSTSWKALTLPHA